MDPDIFFPQRGQHYRVNEAVAACMVCPVMDQCDDYQKRTGSEYGVWAGALHTRKEATKTQ